MADVFISYARANQPVVRQLAEAVKRLGYSAWWDDALPAHRPYSEVISDEIGAAKAAITVWSEDAAASEWVRAEADAARTQRKLIQVSIDGRMPPMPFNQIQFAAIGDWRGEEDHPGWMKVKASLEALCGAPDGAPPPVVSNRMPVAPPPPDDRPERAAGVGADRVVAAGIAHRRLPPLAARCCRDHGAAERGCGAAERGWASGPRARGGGAGGAFILTNRR